MSYKSIMVNIGIDGPMAPIVKLALDLAIRHEARLVGLCAADAPLPLAGPEAGAMAVEVWQQMKDAIGERQRKLHAEFDELVAGSVPSGWRAVLDNPTRALARSARLADLVVTAAPQGAASGNAFRVADPGSAVLQAGRPILVAAEGAEHVLGKTVVVAWKDTREARRAVADAIPLMKLANEVSVVTVDAQPDDWIRAGVDDVAAYLWSHGIKARSEVIKAKDEGESLTRFVTSCRADVVVSGAYGHSRLREWVFGGVTRSLLDTAELNRFMSS